MFAYKGCLVPSILPEIDSGSAATSADQISRFYEGVIEDGRVQGGGYVGEGSGTIILGNDMGLLNTPIGVIDLRFGGFLHPKARAGYGGDGNPLGGADVFERSAHLNQLRLNGNPTPRIHMRRPRRGQSLVGQNNKGSHDENDGNDGARSFAPVSLLSS